MTLKKPFRILVSNAAALMFSSYLIDGFEIDRSFQVIAISAAVLSLVNLFVKPILKAISFPINIVTLGLFGLIVNAALLYLTIYLVDGITISSGAVYIDFYGLIIPKMHLTWHWILLLTATIISSINWLLKKVIF